jgi:hypothetical protein
MHYLPGMEETQGDVITKLLGVYERELHAAVAGWRVDPPALIANVGCAEGYYAVGLAVALPQTRVLAYDIDPKARELCERLARLNRVEDRIEIHGECTPETLAALPSQGTAVLSDCEGYELTLLDPVRIPALAGWRVLAECHDFVDPSITATLEARFRPTHEVTVIASDPAPPVPDAISYLSRRRRAAVLSERPVAMNWIVMDPRRV